LGSKSSYIAKRVFISNAEVFMILAAINRTQQTKEQHELAQLLKQLATLRSQVELKYLLRRQTTKHLMNMPLSMVDDFDHDYQQGLKMDEITRLQDRIDLLTRQIMGSPPLVNYH
jgi:hypothetical protein